MKRLSFFLVPFLFLQTTEAQRAQSAEKISALIFEISGDGRPCSVEEFYATDQSRVPEADAKVEVSLEGESLVFKFDLPEFQSEREVKRCYLSDEADLRLVPNISLCLDPTHGHGVYYKFIVDSEGRRQDLRVDDESWTTEWTAVSRQEGGRFLAEVRIPVAGIADPITSAPDAGAGTISTAVASTAAVSNAAAGSGFEGPAELEGRFWGFDVSFHGIFSQGSLHSTPMGLRSADAKYFGHLLFTGDLGKGEIKELRSSLPAIHASMEQEKLEANRAMCGPKFKQLEAEITPLVPGEDITLKNGVEITVLGVDNDPLIRSSYPFFYEKYSNPELQRLRKQYNLEEIIVPGKNDFEQILLLNEWLVEHVPFGAPPSMRPQALQVLYHGLNGQTFYCTYLSFTLMQMYCSLGFTARKLTSVGHGTLDVWSNYWRKWIQIDPSRNSYFRMVGTAVPLNSHEIRREYHRNGGVDMEMVFGTEQRAERLTLERRDRDGAYRYRQEGFEWIAYKSRNNFFELPFAYWNYDYLILEDEYNENTSWQSGGNRDVRDVLGIRTRRTGDVFWTLNQAYIHLYDQGDGRLKVQLETHTPNFEGFELSLDNGEWQPSEAVFSWDVHEGQNFLRTRSVNKFGVRGPEYKIVLKRNQ